jgi:hypothetical protein
LRGARKGDEAIQLFARGDLDCFALLCFALLCFALLCFALLCFASLAMMLKRYALNAWPRRKFR